MPKKSKRDDNIARASLCVYPVRSALEDFENERKAAREQESGISMHFDFSMESNGLSINNALHVSDGKKRGSDFTFSSVKFRGWQNVDGANGDSYRIAECFNFDQTRTIDTDYSQKKFMNNFALVCLELYARKQKARQAFTLRKLLSEKELPNRVCWSRAVADMAAVKRTDTSRLSLNDKGFLIDCPTLDGWEESGISIASLIQMAQSFTPSTAPVQNHLVPWDICLTHKNYRP